MTHPRRFGPPGPHEMLAGLEGSTLDRVAWLLEDDFGFDSAEVEAARCAACEARGVEVEERAPRSEFEVQRLAGRPPVPRRPVRRGPR